MTDIPDIEIPINAAAVARYERLSRLAGCVFIAIAAGFFAFILTFVKMEGDEKRGKTIIVSEYAINAVVNGSVTVPVFFVLAYLISLMVRFRPSTTTALVRGPYLIIQNDGFIRRNRKLHFRDLNDYSVTDGPLMRHCGIQALEIGPAMRGAPAVRLVGVVDAETWRDRLCELDRERENL